MPLFVEGEERIFVKAKTESRKSARAGKDSDYEGLFDKRIVTESNRERLPNFVKGILERRNINARPAYQRRPRWTDKQKSRLIESFLMNLPVPPIFLYENAANSYEIVDGQQRVTALLDFYNNKLVLKGIKSSPLLNRKTYATLPPKVRDEIDRRSIAYITLMTESAKTDEEAFAIKREVFERLNTGGVKLSAQEIRNCLAESEFNEMVKRLARLPAFTSAWGIPPRSNNDDNVASKEFKQLQKNKIYSTMQDVELVLRFFVFRHSDQINAGDGAGGLKRLIDKYMIAASKFGPTQLAALERLFTDTIDVAQEIFAGQLFRAWRRQTWDKRRYKELYDAVMVGISRNLEHKDTLIQRRKAIITETQALLEADKAGIYIGKGKTKAQIKERIDGFDDLLKKVLAG